MAGDGGRSVAAIATVEASYLGRVASMAGRRGVSTMLRGRLPLRAASRLLDVIPALAGAVELREPARRDRRRARQARRARRAGLQTVLWRCASVSVVGWRLLTVRRMSIMRMFR